MQLKWVSSARSAGIGRNPIFRDIEPRSLFVLKQAHMPRQLLIRLVRCQEFNFFILCAIVANAVLMAMDNPLEAPQQWQLDLDLGFNLMFTCVLFLLISLSSFNHVLKYFCCIKLRFACAERHLLITAALKWSAATKLPPARSLTPMAIRSA